MTTEYKDTLQEIIEEIGLDDLEAPQWERLNPLIQSDVLLEAYECGLGISWCPSMVSSFHRRELKTMERINIKRAMSNRGFRTNCDFMGFCLATKKIEDIPNIVGQLVEHYHDELGFQVHVRKPYGGKDIIQYMYIYHANVGYIAEYQIGHPFASLMFKHDSGVRDGKHNSVDFDKGKIPLYSIVKAKLLANEPVDIIELWKQAFDQIPTREWKECF